MKEFFYLLVMAKSLLYLARTDTILAYLHDFLSASMGWLLFSLLCGMIEERRASVIGG